MFRALAIGLLSLLYAMLPGVADATTLNEIKVGIRIIDFLANPPSGKTPVVILFDGQNKASFEDAQAILAGLTQFHASSKAELVPELRDVRQIDADPAAPIAFLASGTTPFYDRIFEFAQKTGMLTMSTDLACVHAFKCTVGIAGAPHVQVVVSQYAAGACNIVFTEAFRMMIREI